MQEGNKDIPKKANEQDPEGLSRDPNKLLSFSISSSLKVKTPQC